MLAFRTRFGSLWGCLPLWTVRSLVEAPLSFIVASLVKPDSLRGEALHSTHVVMLVLIDVYSGVMPVGCSQL